MRVADKDVVVVVGRCHESSKAVEERAVRTGMDRGEKMTPLLAIDLEGQGPCKLGNAQLQEGIFLSSCVPGNKPQDLPQHCSGLHSMAESQWWVIQILPPEVGSPRNTEQEQFSSNHHVPAHMSVKHQQREYQGKRRPTFS